MGATRRRFTEEYKEEAVAFVIDGGRPVAEVARNIGVHGWSLAVSASSARSPHAGALGSQHNAGGALTG
jgi:transposase